MGDADVADVAARAGRLVAAMMRLEAGRDPRNEELTALIGELSTLGPQFREDWAGHDVHEHRHGVKSFRHPEVGVIEVTFDVFEMPGEAGLQIVTYSVPPGTDSADRFALLAAWAADLPSGDGRGDQRRPDQQIEPPAM